MKSAPLAVQHWPERVYLYRERGSVGAAPQVFSHRILRKERPDLEFIGSGVLWGWHVDGSPHIVATIKPAKGVRYVV